MEQEWQLACIDRDLREARGHGREPERETGAVAAQLSGPIVENVRRRVSAEVEEERVPGDLSHGFLLGQTADLRVKRYSSAGRWTTSRWLSPVASSSPEASIRRRNESLFVGRARMVSCTRCSSSRVKRGGSSWNPMGA